ncbi:hypothetical protein, partial [Leclercia sp. GLN_9]|uniref:hypothetical protein n=1 Tax=Leclercia sp. GLN_9 TaxID=3367184 RepID=UPI00370B9E7B
RAFLLAGFNFNSQMHFHQRFADFFLHHAGFALGYRNRKHRKACARDFAGASIETDADIPNQAEADDRLAEELTYWAD